MHREEQPERRIHSAPRAMRNPEGVSPSLFRGSSVVEQLTVNQLAASSNLAPGAMKRSHLAWDFFMAMRLVGLATHATES